MKIIDVTKSVAERVSSLSKKNVAEAAIGTGIGVMAICAGYFIRNRISDYLQKKEDDEFLKIKLDEDRDAKINELAELSAVQADQLHETLEILKEVVVNVDYLLARDDERDDCDDDYSDYDDSSKEKNVELNDDQEDKE